MILGSLYSGVGGLDWAAEHALGATTAWQLDLLGGDVRRRHWPDALQIEADVATVDPDDLPAVDVLAASFACQDLSCAGLGAGLVEGARTGPTYRHLLRFAGARLTDEGFERDEHRRWLPEVVVMENVLALLTTWRAHLEADWHRLGYGLTWVRARALDVGAPHIRRRVFVVAVRGGPGGRVLDAPSGFNEGEDPRSFAARSAALVAAGSRPVSEPLGLAVRPWPTPTVGDARASGSRCLDSAAHEGTSLTDAVRADRTVAGERPWATPRASDDRSAGTSRERAGRDGGHSLQVEVRPRASPTCSDARTGWTQADPERAERRNLLGDQTGGGRLSADWVETLMGFPVGWTLPVGERLEVDPDPRWPRGRYPADWDRSVPWPSYDWEPARVLPAGPAVLGRPARLRALGNAVCPQQGGLAIRRGLAAPAQGVMW